MGLNIPHCGKHIIRSFSSNPHGTLCHKLKIDGCFYTYKKKNQSYKGQSEARDSLDLLGQKE